jgi:hypothetical protein
MDRFELPKGLRKKILVSIKQEEIRRAQVYVVTALTAITTSLIGAMFALRYMLQGFYQSSFYSYFSLIFSDPDIAASYWRELSMSLVETAPLVGVTLSLVTLASFMISLRVLVKHSRPDLIPLFNN